MMVYGRAAEAGEHELRVVYPLYSGILFAPFALVGNYVVSRALWMTFLEFVVVGMVVLSLRLARWQPKPWLVGMLILMGLFWYHGLRAIINGNAILVVSLCLLWAFWSIGRGQDVVAGFALAFATIKPHVVILVLVFILLWAFSHRRWSLIGWTFGWFFFLVLLGIFFIPDWPLRNAWELMKFSEYNPALTLGNALVEWWPGIGRQLNWILTAVLVVVLGIEWWLAWKKDFDHFLWTACLTLVAGQWVGIPTDPGNFGILFLAMVLVFSIVKERWGRGGDWIILGLMVLITVGPWVLFIRTLDYSYQPIQDAIMFVPVPLFTLIGLYWVRWWIIRPTRKILAG